MAREIGVSLISFFPTFLMPGGYDAISRILDYSNLGIQLLPLRGLTEKHVKKFKVLSLDGPWNYGSIWDALKRTAGAKNPDYPSLIDIGLFGSELNCRKRIKMIKRLCPDALRIDIPGEGDSAIELGHNMYLGNARRWSNRKPAGVVLDTYHWRKFPSQEAEHRLAQLGGYEAVRMVHLKLMSSEETHAFLEGKDTNTSLLKKFLAHDKAGKIPVIIEAKNNALHIGYDKAHVLELLACQIRAVLA